MDELQNTLLAIVALIPIVSGVVTYLSYRLQTRKNVRDEKSRTSKQGEHYGVLLTEIGAVKSGIEDLKQNTASQELLNRQLIAEIATLTASAKQAHKRIDEMAGKKYPGVKYD